MTPTDERLRELAARMPGWSDELRKLETLVDVDVAASLNKIRTLTERMLHELCSLHEVKWGKGEPTLERMIGPLLSAGHIPKQVGIHIRTVQSNASPGSHYQEHALDDQHLMITLVAFLAVLDWYAPIAPESPAPAALPPPDAPSSSAPARALLFGGAGLVVATVLVLAVAFLRSDPGPVDTQNGGSSKTTEPKERKVTVPDAHDMAMPDEALVAFEIRAVRDGVEAAIHEFEEVAAGTRFAFEIVTREPVWLTLSHPENGAVYASDAPVEGRLRLPEHGGMFYTLDPHPEGRGTEAFTLVASRQRVAVDDALAADGGTEVEDLAAKGFSEEHGMGPMRKLQAAGPEGVAVLHFEFTNVAAHPR